MVGRTRKSRPTSHLSLVCSLQHHRLQLHRAWRSSMEADRPLHFLPFGPTFSPISSSCRVQYRCRSQLPRSSLASDGRWSAELCFGGQCIVLEATAEAPTQKPHPRRTCALVWAARPLVLAHIYRIKRTSKALDCGRFSRHLYDSA